MKKISFYAVFLLVFCFMLLCPASAVAATLDEDGSDGYTGQYLLLQNVNFNRTAAAATVGRLSPYSSQVNSSLSRLLLATAEQQAIVNGWLTVEPQWQEPPLEQPVQDEFATSGPAASDHSGLDDLSTSISLAEMAQEDTFTVNDFKTNGLATVDAQLLYEGTWCLVYGETAASAAGSNGAGFSLNADQGQQIGQFFDTQVRQAMVDNFGSYQRLFTDFTLRSDKIVLLCYDIRDDFDYPQVRQYYGGYFWATDLYSGTFPGTQGYARNNLAMLHIDTFPLINKVVGSNGSTLTTQVTVSNCYSTIVHEFQHMINYAMTSGKSDTWLNELCSMGAEEIFFGALNNRISGISSFPEVVRNGAMLIYDSYDENNNNLGANYSLPYLFGQYLRLQTAVLPGGGDAIFRAINDHVTEENSSSGAVIGALFEVGYTDVADFAQLVRNFYLAMVLKEPSGVFGFPGDSAYQAIFLPSYTTDYLTSPLYAGNTELPALTLKPSAAVYLPLPQSVQTDGNAAGEIAILGFTSQELPLDSLDHFGRAQGGLTTQTVGLTMPDNISEEPISTLLCLAYYDEAGRLYLSDVQTFDQEPGADGSRLTVSLTLPTAAPGHLRLFACDVSGANIIPLCPAVDLTL